MSTTRPSTRSSAAYDPSVTITDRPPASSPDALARMRRQRRRDTGAERALRSELHRRGLRFRVEYKLPGLRRRADVAFPRQRVAVMVDGCFWHSCPEHGTWPKQNASWWREKIERNVARDHDTDAKLTHAGWVSMRVWEHENPAEAAARVASVVSRRADSRSKTRMVRGRQ
jgi:DNA mismatch endonuclease, patch repair protein